VIPPRFVDLEGGRSWGVFGDDDLSGTLNFIGADEVCAAATLVRKGKVFALNTPIDVPGPAMFHRHDTRHEVITSTTPDGGTWVDDWLDSFWLQGSSQWDSLRHFGDDGGIFYGGRGASENAVLGIDRIAERGIVSRAVLLDLGRSLEFDPFEPTAFGADDIERTLPTPLRRGDVLLVRTGWLDKYLSFSDAERSALGGGTPGSAGLYGPDLAPFLWDAGVAALATDNPAVEPLVPGVGADHATHKQLLSRLGMPLGELWEFGALAADCAADGVYEMLFTSAPLHVRGGAGSPPNALAIK